MTNTHYRTVAQAAEMLVVTPDKIRDLIRSGQLVAIDVSLHQGGKARWRIPTDELERWIASRRTSPPPKKTRTRRSPAYTPRYY